MITTISEYSSLGRESGGIAIPAATTDTTTTKLTAAGNVVTASATRFVRIATDSAVHISIGSAATTSDAYIPAGVVEFFAVTGGDTVYIAVAS